MQDPVHADEWRILIKFTRMVAAHLLEHWKDLFLPFIGNCSLNQSDQCLFIGMNIRRQPKGRARAAVNGVGAAVFKGFAAECPNEA